MLSKKMVLLFFIVLMSSMESRAQTMQTLTGETTLTCPQDVTLTLQSSEVGFNYFLRDEADNSIVDGPIAGTGNALDFQTGEVSETSNYHVFATGQSFALDFDGVDDTVQIPHDSINGSLDFSTDITIEGWVNVTEFTADGFDTIFRKDNNTQGRILFRFNTDVSNNTKLEVGMETTGSGYFQFSSNVNQADFLNKWAHVATFFDDQSNAMRLYVNGVELGSGAGMDGSLVPVSNPSEAYIGSYNGTEELFKGKIAALRLWNTAPSSAQEVSDLHANGQANVFIGTESGLVTYYPFIENSGAVLTDQTANNNDGNIVGATWTSGTNLSLIHI